MSNYQVTSNSNTGGVDSIVAGANINVDNTDPENPIVSVSGTTQNAIQIGNASGSLTSLAIANNSTLVTNGSGVPSLSTTLPSAVQANITELGAITALTASQAVVTNGSKNLVSLAYTNANTASTLVQRDGSGNFSAGTITANLTGTASNATTATTSTTSTVTSTTTNASFFPAFMSATSGNLGINVNSSLTYNPSTTTLSVPVATHSGSSGSLLTPLSISNAGAGGVSFAIGASTNTATISLSSTPSQPLTFGTGGSALGFNFIGALSAGSASQFTVSNSGVITAGTWNASLIPLVYGGTNANLTASNGGIVYSTSSAMAILSGVAAANRVLLSGNATAPAWSTATYPATTTVSQLLYSSATNTVAGLATANNSVLVTSGTGVPSLGLTVANNFSYTSTTAGTARVLTVSNTDNTNAASNARLQLTTGGASSGDAVATFTVTGVTNWTLGVDNSDSDSLVISASTTLGITNVMRANTSGQFNYPLQPAFSAYKSFVSNNVTGDLTLFTIIFDTEVFDQAGNYNNATGVFTAPITGRYQFSAGALLYQGTNISLIDTSFGTSNRNYFYSTPQSSFTRSGNPLSALVDMDAGDVCTVRIQSTDSGGKVDDLYGDLNMQTFFTGYLAC